MYIYAYIYVHIYENAETVRSCEIAICEKNKYRAPEFRPILSFFVHPTHPTDKGALVS